jgi:hypothetical protein
LDLKVVKKHKFYISAVLLATIALVLNMMGRDRFVQASRHKAQRIAAAQEQHTSYLMDSESARLGQSGRVLTTVGVTLAFFGLGSMIVALIRREGGWYLFLVGVLLSDIVAVMLL